MTNAVVVIVVGVKATGRARSWTCGWTPGRQAAWNVFFADLTGLTGVGPVTVQAVRC